ncbi:hypothetical protein M514_10064 [Trichuris suis]|uniref:Uncharacterized protein n=1 Tax=Trichuris suis TaxID=68888 RepID=A0A085LVM0_9BILA|nr:hypothetical protein M513_10064 [Trichuris suis]KFD60972.1 hypothetical protein M514_10064 [Trichuris suis]
MLVHLYLKNETPSNGSTGRPLCFAPVGRLNFALIPVGRATKHERVCASADGIAKSYRLFEASDSV